MQVQVGWPFAAFGVRSGESHRRLVRCDVQTPGINSQMFLSRPLDMSGVPVICFRLGSVFGTGMVIEGDTKVH